MTSKEKGESAKLQHHLTLLKEEFVKLQSHCNELERKYAIACAAGGEVKDNSFVTKLVHTVSELFNQELFSDMNVKLADRSVPAHRLVLASRGDKWGSLSDCKELDWSKWGAEVALSVLKWLYTDQADLSRGDSFTLDLMRMANDFQLEGLVSKCEKALMVSVNVRNCVRFYITADEINADALKEHCSGLISAHWDDFTSEDFASMSARLLYSMFKSKTGFPLHAAVRLNREDVVFLYLVENTADLSNRLNACDARGSLPLDLALAGRQLALAATLADHGADPDARDAAGETPLLRASRRRDAAAAAFLLARGAAPNAAAAASGDTPLHLAAAAVPDADATDAALRLEGDDDAPVGPTTPSQHERGNSDLVDGDGSEQGDVATLAKQLLDAGADPNLHNNEGYTPLHLAVLARNASVLALLLAEGRNGPKVDVNARTADGHPPLWFALLAEAGAASLSASAQATASTGAGDAPEADACGHNSPYAAGCAAERLLSAGAAPNPAYPPPAQPAGDRLLHRLTREALEQAALFIAERAPLVDLSAANAWGETALHVACARGLSRLVTRLLQRGVPANAQTLRAAASSPVPTKKTRIPPAERTPFDDDDEDADEEKEAGGDGQLPARETALHVAVRCKQEGAVRAIVEFAKRRREGEAAEADGGGEGDGATAAAGGAVDFDARDSAGATPLALAISSGQQHLVPLLLDGGADVNVRDGRGLSLLHRALQAGDSSAALFLLEHGADPHLPAPAGLSANARPATPLQLAIRARLPAVVEALCRRGADLSAATAVGSSAPFTEGEGDDPPLWEALAGGQADVAATLVRHGADPDCWGPGPDGCLQTLLHRALDENNEPVAKFLIRSGCDLNAARRAGPSGGGGETAAERASPLHLCCQWGLEEAARTLVEHGADVNARDADQRTPLHAAVRAQHAAITSLLLCHPGLDLSLRDRSGLTPFATALTVRNPRAAEAILDRLPTAAEQVDGKGRNFLHTAIIKGDVESVLFLLSVQVDVNSRVQDADQTPPLLLAAEGGDEMLVRSLILAGARVNDTDSRRHSALHAAAAAGHASVVAALLQNSADCDAQDADGEGALHAAARAGQLAAARVLLTESQADAEAVDLRGRTPLHSLARSGRDNAAAIADLFLECMPKYPLDRPDLEGNTALLLAYMKGNGNLCRTLVKAGACLGCMNKEGITIFNYQVATKQLLYRLLDHLSQEPPWAEGDICLECGSKFGLTMRKHHCRHCGRILCSKCSGRDVPILKFNLNKPVRVCAVCFDVLQVGCT